jgi:hypothetical protein
LLDGVQQLLDIFLAKGFALKGSLTPGPGADAFSVRLEGPANLWSLQVGGQRGAAGGCSADISIDAASMQHIAARLVRVDRSSTKYFYGRKPNDVCLVLKHPCFCSR